VNLQAGNGTIYYTLDGSDPRSPGGGVAATARRYTGPFPLTESARLVARALDAGIWGSPTSASLHVLAPLRVTEILYHPQDPPFGSAYGNQGDYQFVELQNTGGYPLSLGGMRFTKGILFTFPDITLPAGGRTLVVKRKAAFESRYGANLPIAGEFESDSSLSSEGETIELIDAIGMPIQSFDYVDRWYPLTDGPGLSLVVSDVRQSPELWSARRGWHASQRIGGSPGQPEPATPAAIPVVINEVLSKSDPPDDAIELYNPTDLEADIGGWFLSDNYDVPWKFRFPAGTRIPPHGFLVLDEYSSFNSQDLDSPFGLSDGGESVFLYSADPAGKLTGYVHAFTFGAASVNTGFGRYVTPDGDEFVAPQSYVAEYGGRVSWWETNAPPDAIPVGLNPTLALTELMTDPSVFGGITNSSSEFLEIRNIGTTNLDMTGARFTRGIVFTFPQVILRPGDYAVVVQNRTTFTNRYGTGIAIVGEYSGFLSGSGEILKLEGARGEPVLEFTYDGSWYPITRLNWGPEKDFSIVLRDEGIAPQAYGTAAAWRPSTRPGGSPGEGDPAPGSEPMPRLNEVLMDEDGHLQSVELYNPGDHAIDVGGWLLLTDAGPPGSPGTYLLPPRSAIPAGGYLVLHPDTPVTGTQISLLATDSAGRLTGHLETLTIPRGHQAYVGYGRYPADQGLDQVVAELAPSFGAENGSVQSGPVVISEIFHHPPSPAELGECQSTDDTFIELHNRTAETAFLYDLSHRSRTWQLAGGVSFRFTSQNAFIPPGGYVLVVGFDPRDTFRLEAFRRRLGVPAGLAVFGPFVGTVGRDSGTVALWRPSSDIGTNLFETVERVDYIAAPPWPGGTAGEGRSLQRVRNQAYADDPASWGSALPTPGWGLAEAAGPRFTRQPSDAQVAEGGFVDFVAAGTGDAPLVYQWLFNGTPINGATNATLRLQSVGLWSQGAYVCVLFNGADAVASRAAQLRVIPGPVLMASPQSATVAEGGSVLLSVLASSSLSPPVCSLFVDGVLAATASMAFDTPDVGFLELGGAPSGLSGNLDEVSVYSRALKAEEVAAIHLAGSNGKAPPLRLAPGLSASGGIRLRWDPRAGVRLEAATRLANAVWEGIPPANPDGQWDGPAEGPFKIFRLQQETESLPPPAGLVAWWPGEGTGADLIRSNSLTMTGVDFAPGLVGRAFHFGKITDVARAPLGSLPSRNADRTIEFWFRPTTAGMSNSTLLGFVPGTNSVPIDPLSVVQGELTWSLADQHTLHVPISAESWHHVALTVAGDLTYQWRRDGIPLPGATLRVLELQGVNAALLGNYSVVVSNAWGGVESRPANVQLGDRPIILEQPTNSVGSAGSPPVLRCVATSTLTPIAYHWFKEGLATPVADTPVYEVQGLAAGQSGTYWCQVSNLVGAVLSQRVTARIPGPPRILRDPASVNVLIGSPASFEVSASTTEGVLRYQWLKNLVELPGATSPRLTIEAASLAAAGHYRVRVSTEYGTTLSSVGVLGVGSTPEIVLDPVDHAVLPGQRVTLTCVGRSIGFPMSYRWYHGTNWLPGVVGSSYNLPPIGRAALGDYSCVVLNPVGMVTSRVATLSMADTLPHIQTPPASQTETEGVRIRFSVDVATFGDPVRYQWTLNGVPIARATNSVLVIEKATAADEGFYAVLVWNSAGSVQSEAAVLSLQGVPVLAAPSTVARVTTVPGDLLLLAARVHGGFPIWSQWVRIGPDGATNLLVNHVLTNATDTFRTLATPGSAGLYGLLLSNITHTNLSLLWPVAEVAVGTDIDGDLVDDSWETDHSFDPLNPADAAADPDGDGIPNRSEYAAGTDPWDRNSRLEVQIGRPAEDRISLEFQAISNRTYAVEWKLPSEPRWHNLTYIPAENVSRRERLLEVPGVTGRLYRVSLPTPDLRP
jgi:hypothetical protein